MMLAPTTETAAEQPTERSMMAISIKQRTFRIPIPHKYFDIIIDIIIDIIMHIIL